MSDLPPSVPTDTAEHREMTARVRSFDWGATPLGPRSAWTASLRAVTEMLLAHPFAMALLWGTEFVQIYNDGYRLLMGHKHPGGLGQPNRLCWPEVWAFNAPIYEGVITREERFEFKHQRLVIHRHGVDEEAFFDLTFSPVRDDDGSVGGVLVTVIETTDRVRAAQEVQERQAELDRRNATLVAFATLTRDLTVHGDTHELIRRALETALSLLPPSVGLFYERHGPLWRAVVQVGDVGSPQLQAAVDRGFPVGRTPTLDAPYEQRTPLYQDVYDQRRDLSEPLVDYLKTVATLPVMVNGAVLGIFNVGLFEQRIWSAADRAVLKTAVHSLGLTLEGAAGVAQLAEERRKLSVANEELEAFAYSVSHDLRTPVRHIVGFNQLLRRSLGERLDERSARYLEVVEQAAERMNVLIDAMLDLARTARLPLQQKAVDLDALVRTVQAELIPETENRRVEWRLHDLPSVTGDPETLRQVMVNLLSNALKYTRTREVGVVEVWAQEREQEWEVFVRDNGVGFDSRYANKLFGVFQRLHRADEFEGTGVGLANVRRIVQKHGGRVAAQGRPDEGAVFSFTLPRTP